MTEALPKTCGECEHSVATTSGFMPGLAHCRHPMNRDAALITRPLHEPPPICPIRHAEEIREIKDRVIGDARAAFDAARDLLRRESREAGQVEGATAMRDLAASTCEERSAANRPVAGFREYSIAQRSIASWLRTLDPATVCAEARAQESAKPENTR